MSDLVKDGEFIPEQLTPEDRVYVVLLQQGFTKPEAYIEAYRDTSEALQRQLDIIDRFEELSDEVHEPGTPVYYEHKKELDLMRRRAYGARQRIGQYAREKAKTAKIRMAFTTLVRRMEDIASDGLDVWQDIMLYGKSEKVRADLAIRAVEHQTGQPTQKIVSQSNNEITITIGEAPEDTRDHKQLAADKARMEAGIDKGEYNRLKRREQPQDALVIDVE